MLSKSHQLLVDGVETVDLGQVLLDTSKEPKELDRDDWMPKRAPSPTGLAAGALLDSVLRPSTLVATGQSTAEAAVRTARSARHRTTAVMNALTNRRPSPDSPISADSRSSAVSSPCAPTSGLPARCARSMAARSTTSS